MPITSSLAATPIKIGYGKASQAAAKEGRFGASVALLTFVYLDQIVTVFRQSIPEFLLIVATAVSAIVLPIEAGVAIAIVLSLLHGIWSTTRGRLVVFERVPGTTTWWPANPGIAGERVPDVLVVGLQAPLSFLNASTFRADLLGFLQAAKPRLVVLEAASIPEIDFTAAELLREVVVQCGEHRVTVAVARLESLRAQDAFERFGLYDVLPRDCVFHSVEEAVRALAGGA